MQGPNLDPRLVDLAVAELAESGADLPSVLLLRLQAALASRDCTAALEHMHRCVCVCGGGCLWVGTGVLLSTAQPLPPGEGGSNAPYFPTPHFSPAQHAIDSFGVLPAPRVSYLPHVCLICPTNVVNVCCFY